MSLVVSGEAQKKRLVHCDGLGFIYSDERMMHTHSWFISEFQQRARELGYINGYRYGVEYPTNGKKPDLADDVIVKWVDRVTSSQARSDIMDWSGVLSFRITDQRYKPADTSYLDAPTVKESLTDEWYDYDSQKAIALPPVGVECEVYGALGQYNEWQKCRIMAQHKTFVFVCDDNHWTHRKDVDFQFRPLDHNRKAEAEKKKVVDAAMAIAVDAHMTEDILGSLYDAGYLKLPTE